MFTKQNATWQPSLPNSIAMCRPRPVAPPVTIATLPRQPLRDGLRLGLLEQRLRCPPGPRTPTRAGGRSRRMAMAWASKVRRARRERQGGGSPGHLAAATLFNFTYALENSPGCSSALAGAAGWGVLALHRGETISAAWLVLAAVCTYLVAYPLLQPLPRRPRSSGSTTGGPRRPSGWTTAATSCRPTAGCSSATTSPPSPAPGPLVGPVLAAQFGYLPGTIWIVFGVVLAGAVQDFVILFGSMRRDGKSLGQMAKEEIGPVAGMLAMVAVLAHHGHPARRARARGGERAQGQPVGRLHDRSAPSRSRC